MLMVFYCHIKHFNTVDSLEGVSSGESGRNKEAPIPLFKYELTFGITNQIYTNSLLNTGSDNYQILYFKVKGAVSFTFWFSKSNANC